MRRQTIELVLDALCECGEAEQLLFESGKTSGLFAGRNGSYGQAAEYALREGLLEVVRRQAKGKTESEWVRVTPRGKQFLRQHESPQQVLDELVQLLRPGGDGLPAWQSEVRAEFQQVLQRFEDWVAEQGKRFEALRRRAQEVLRPEVLSRQALLAAWQLDALSYLERHKSNGAGNGCPLPELFHALRGGHPDLSLTVYHDGLMQLRDRGALRLVPFAGPPSGLREPEYALLEGPTVYFAATRT